MSHVLPQAQAPYRLPSIHSLDLDLPVPKPQAYGSTGNHHQLPSPSQSYTPRPMVMAPQPFHFASTQQPPIPHILLVSIPNPQDSYKPFASLQPSQQQAAQLQPQIQPPSQGQFVSPILSPSSHKVDGLSTLCEAASSRSRLSSEAALDRNAAVKSEHLTSPPPAAAFTHSQHLRTPILIMHSLAEEEMGSSGSGSGSASTSENEHDHDHLHDPDAAIGDNAHKTSWKPRKKRQCPECKLFFLNLATHKSTHLKPTARPHVCEFCNRGFARPNDLFRHVKCHWKETGSDKGQFKCPFKTGASGDHCCHSTGIFSRCDTFKNHLKAIHFQYPSGTKKDQRNKVAGTCRACNKHFSNVDDWVTNHVERNSCPYGSDYTA